MTTNNIVSTPNITGNIGSCTSQLVSVDSGRNIFIQYQENIVTNSCTGEIKTYQNWDFTVSTFFIFVVCVGVAWIWLENKYG